MTKDYALFLLNQLCVGASVEAMPIIPQSELSQALSVAIKALEQQLCDDTISRERVLEVQMKYAEHMGATKYWKMRDDIRALPSITPQPKVGRWKELEKIISPNELICECSVCGHVVSFLNDYPKSNYCPKCGAKMIEGEEKNDK